METIGIEMPAGNDGARVAGSTCSLAALHAPQAALDAARRLYQRNRSGLRFFCENRRVIPVDQLEALGEFGEGFDASAAPVAYAAAPPSGSAASCGAPEAGRRSPEAVRSTM